ncbi:MAG: N-acetylmuramoyl-L-alanine amidase [Bacillota bacterium]|nr:N-acetylmuramoyl-L-alanine amidase [Bacillota bacterium]
MLLDLKGLRSTFSLALIGLLLFLALGVAVAAPWIRRQATADLLTGRLILLDPGHGGADPGSVGSNGVLEKDVVLGVSLALARDLRSAGATVVLTRQDDRDLSGLPARHPRRYRTDLYQRATIIEALRPDLFLSIHANAYPDRSAQGAQTFYRPDPLGQNRRLATAIQRELVAVTGMVDRGISSDIRQLVLNRAEMPAATVEIGFLSNPEEERRLTDPEYQKKVAWGVFLGVIRFLEEAPLPAEAPPARSQRGAAGAR